MGNEERVMEVHAFHPACPCSFIHIPILLLPSPVLVPNTNWRSCSCNRDTGELRWCFFCPVLMKLQRKIRSHVLEWENFACCVRYVVTVCKFLGILGLGPCYVHFTHRSVWLFSAFSTRGEPFQVNLTAACNFGCECHTTDVEPVCGNNGLTYFSPCHAGCTALSSRSNYTNCACKYL